MPSGRIILFLRKHFPSIFAQIDLLRQKFTDLKYYYMLNNPVSNGIEKFMSFFRPYRDKILDYILFKLIGKIQNFFWYFNILERIFDIIGNICYYWIQVPYDRFILHMDTVVLPPIREKYKKWRFKKGLTFRLFKRKNKILLYRYIDLKFPDLAKFLLSFKNCVDHFLIRLFKTLFNPKLFKYRILLMVFIERYFRWFYMPIKEEIDQIFSDNPDYEENIKEFILDHGWAWYPAGLTFYQLAFIIYVLWLRYQFFYDTAFANVEFYHQRMEYVIHARRALFENTEMWGTAYATASIHPDSYYNAYYDKENKFRATHLFYDRFILSPIQAYKVYTWHTQGSSVLHWGSILYWQRQASFKTFSFASSFVERCLPDYYLKNLKNIVITDEKHVAKNFHFNQRKIYKVYDKRFTYWKKPWTRKWRLEIIKRPRFTTIPLEKLPREYPTYEDFITHYWWTYYESRFDRTSWKIKFSEIPIHEWATQWWSPVNIHYTDFLNDGPYDAHDTYSSVLSTARSPYWFLNSSKDVSFLLYYKNDFYGLFLNPYTACGLKNFFVFEQIFSYILNNLNEMTLSESISRRYQSESHRLDTFVYKWAGSSFDALKRHRASRTCFWENYTYFNAPFQWRAVSAYRSRFWDLRAHIGTFLWPIYNGETDTSYWGIRNYFYAFAYHYRPYYYYFNLIHYFYREIFGHLWIFFTLMYIGFIGAIAQQISKYKHWFYYDIYNLTEIKELEYLISVDIWIRSFRIVYFFLVIFINFYFIMDYYAANNTFIHTYSSLINIIKEFQDLDDLYCDFNDYGYGENFLLLAMSPEFNNYAGVAKRFLKDPYIAEEIDLYENSFRRRDLAFDYEYFMTDNYFFLRSYTSNDDSDTIFYKKWWADSFSNQNFNLLKIIKNQNLPFVFAPNYYDRSSKVLQNLKKTMIKLWRIRYFRESNYLKTIPGNLIREFFVFVFFKFQYNMKKVHETTAVDEEKLKHFYYYFEELYRNILKDKNISKREPPLQFFSKSHIQEEFAYNLFFPALLRCVNNEAAELKKFQLKNILISEFIFKYSYSKEGFYDSQMTRRWLNKTKKTWPFFRNGDDDFTKALKWHNKINPFASVTPSFFPHLYFEEDWFQNTLTRVLRKKFTHFRGTFYYLWSRNKTSKKMIKKIDKFQSFLNFPYIMAQRISKSLLYLEVTAQLDRMDVENLQNFRLNHEASRTTFSKRFFSTLNKHFKIYFRSTWVYGPWDARAMRLDNSISKFCHYYVRAGRYHNLSRMSLYVNGVKKIREEQWENREIPAPPNHMLEDALWYRLEVAPYKKGMGRRRVAFEWFFHTGLNTVELRNSKKQPLNLPKAPFLFFLRHTKNFLFYTFNPKIDIIQANSTFNLNKVPNFLPFFNIEPEFTVFSDYIQDSEANDPWFEREIDLYPDDSIEDRLEFDDRDYYWDHLSFDNNYFDFFRNKILSSYKAGTALNFNLFQFVFCCYFGQFTEHLLVDYYKNKNESFEKFEALTLIPGELISNNENRLNFYYSSWDLLGPNVIYPVQYFGFFPFDLRPQSCDQFYTIFREYWFKPEYTTFNKFFQIEEMSPSWSKIILTIYDIKLFHENYSALSWLNRFNIIKNNNGYWFYFIYKSTFGVFIFINILFYFHKVMLESVRSFRFEKSKKKIYYFIGEFLHKERISEVITDKAYEYWFYWFIVFIIFQILFWINEFFIFVGWVVNSMPFIIDFIFY